jgi:hypothetical protein
MHSSHRRHPRRLAEAVSANTDRGFAGQDISRRLPSLFPARQRRSRSPQGRPTASGGSSAKAGRPGPPSPPIFIASMESRPARAFRTEFRRQGLADTERRQLGRELPTRHCPRRCRRARHSRQTQAIISPINQDPPMTRTTLSDISGKSFTIPLNCQTIFPA